MSCLIGMEPTRPGWPPGFAKERSRSLSCYMEHSGNHSTHPVPSGKLPVLQSEWLNLLYVLVAVAVAVAVATAFFICVHQLQEEEIISGRGSRAREPADLWINTRLGRETTGMPHSWDFRPLMSAPGSTGSAEGCPRLYRQAGRDSTPCLDLTSTFPLFPDLCKQRKYQHLFIVVGCCKVLVDMRCLHLCHIESGKEIMTNSTFLWRLYDQTANRAYHECRMWANSGLLLRTEGLLRAITPWCSLRLSTGSSRACCSKNAVLQAYSGPRS
ncbi:hypothetical protein H8959_010190 [Pygathrix nigripes]